MCSNLTMTDNSEFREYNFIGQALKDIGWDIRNPSKYSAGQVYTQNESLQNTELKKYLIRQKPENVVQINEKMFWVIEAKGEHDGIEQAVSEAKAYAEDINESDKVKCLFATGVAGNINETHLVETYFLTDNGWKRVKINDFATTGFLDPIQIKQIIATAKPNIKDQEIPEELFIQKANEINVILHKGAINKKNRARVIASLLLALVNDEYMKISQDPTTLITDINTRVEALLRKYDKEKFAQEIRINLPSSTDNHVKSRRALVDCIQELRNLNIRSAINSGSDILGQFYEIFLKYANDAKEIGIVLTPRHITHFAADALNITERDYVYDPTCGTGGFLVSALDTIKKNSPTYLDDFKTSHIYGIEQDPEIVALALVNMIFRGDGKSNIYEGNCFDNLFIKEDGKFKKIKNTNDIHNRKKNFITKTLMNPPFALNEEEHAFVDHALNQMVPGGLLFTILPTSTLTSTSDGRKEITWRKNLLKRHTLKAVIKLSDELFSPNANKGTYAAVIEAWKPHENKKVFWAIMDDGFTMKKSKRLPSKNLPSNIGLITDELRAFLIVGKKPKVVPRVINYTLIGFDETFDCGAEAYINDNVVKNDANVSSTVSNLFQSLLLQKQRNASKLNKSIKQIIVSIDDIFETVVRGDCPPLTSMNIGNIPVITTSEVNNGIAEYYDVGESSIYEDKITISANGSSCKAFYHPYKFGAVGDVLVCQLKDDFDTLELKMFIASAINQSGWRFSYYRKCTEQKLKKDVKISLPSKNGKIDINYINNIIHNTVGFEQIKEYLKK